MTHVGSGRGGSYMYRTWDLADGQWNDVRGFRHFSLDVQGIQADLRLYGSNTGEGKGHEIGETTTMDGLVEIDLTVGYIRAEALDDGAITANLLLLGVEGCPYGARRRSPSPRPRSSTRCARPKPPTPKRSR